MSNCTYTFNDPLNGDKQITIEGLPALKAYLFKGGAEALLGKVAGELLGTKSVITSSTDISRSKPVKTIVFKTPIAGKNGDRIVSYSWSWKDGLKFDKHDGGEVDTRVSDWDNAVKNDDTGKLIVHQFSIIDSNGVSKTVSLESANKILGGENALSLARAEINRDWLRTVAKIKSVIYEKYAEWSSKTRKSIWSNEDAHKDNSLLMELVDDLKYNADRVPAFGTGQNNYYTTDREISALIKKSGSEIDDIVDKYKNLLNGDSEKTFDRSIDQTPIESKKSPPIYKTIHAAINSGNIDNVLDYLSNNAKDKYIQGIAKKLQSKIPDGITLNVLDSHKKGYGMSYTNKDKSFKIFLSAWEGNENSAVYERALIHEFIHAATINQIDKNNAVNAQLKSIITDLKSYSKNNQLDPALKEVVDHATENTYELIAYGLSDPSLQNLMQKIKASGDITIWDKLVRAISDMLGIELNEEQETALSALLMVGDSLLGDTKAQPSNYQLKGNVTAASLKTLAEKNDLKVGDSVTTGSGNHTWKIVKVENNGDKSTDSIFQKPIKTIVAEYTNGRQVAAYVPIAMDSVTNPTDTVANMGKDEAVNPTNVRPVGAPPIDFWDKGIYEPEEWNDLKWMENSKGMYAWFKGDKQVTGAYVNGTKQMADYALDAHGLISKYERDAANKVKIEAEYNKSVIEQRNRLEKTWGRMTDKELDTRIAWDEKQIKDGHHAAKREFNMRNGRRTSAAVSAEAARVFAEEKRDLLIYKQIRAEKQSQPTNTEESAQPVAPKNKISKAARQKLYVALLRAGFKEMYSSDTPVGSLLINGESYSDTVILKNSDIKQNFTIQTINKDGQVGRIELTPHQLVEAAKLAGNPVFDKVDGIDNIKPSKSTQSTNTHTKSTLTSALRTVMDREYGSGWTQRLFDTGKFEVMTRAEAQTLEPMANLDNVQGYYSAKHDKTILIAEQIAKGKDLKGLMLHEIAAHQLKLGVDDETFQAILAQVEKLANSKLFAKAKAAAIEADTPAEHMNEEILAYLLEHHPKLGVVQKFLAWFKSKLRAMGKALPKLEQLKWVRWANSLNESDLVSMASGALRNAPNDLMFDSVGRSGEAVKLSESGKLLAPNGKPSNLNAMQYAQVRTPEFLNWFGDWINDPANASKVVDENGEPMVVYHGTNKTENDFYKFSHDKYRTGNGRNEGGMMFYFTPFIASAKAYAFTSARNHGLEYDQEKKWGNEEDYERIVNAFLNIRNPIEVESVEDQIDSQFLRENNDGMIRRTWYALDGDIDNYNENNWASEINEIGVDNPNQIKSATGNTGAFSQDNNDIRYSKSSLQSKITDAIDSEWLNIVNEMKRQGVIDIKC